MDCGLVPSEIASLPALSVLHLLLGRNSIDPAKLTFCHDPPQSTHVSTGDSPAMQTWRIVSTPSIVRSAARLVAFFEFATSSNENTESSLFSRHIRDEYAPSSIGTNDVEFDEECARSATTGASKLACAAAALMVAAKLRGQWVLPSHVIEAVASRVSTRSKKRLGEWLHSESEGFELVLMQLGTRLPRATLITLPESHLRRFTVLLFDQNSHRTSGPAWPSSPGDTEPLCAWILYGALGRNPRKAEVSEAQRTLSLWLRDAKVRSNVPELINRVALIMLSPDRFWCPMFADGCHTERHLRQWLLYCPEAHCIVALIASLGVALVSSSNATSLVEGVADVIPCDLVGSEFIQRLCTPLSRAFTDRNQRFTMSPMIPSSVTEVERELLTALAPEELKSSSGNSLGMLVRLAATYVRLQFTPWATESLKGDLGQRFGLISDIVSKPEDGAQAIYWRRLYTSLMSVSSARHFAVGCHLDVTRSNVGESLDGLKSKRLRSETTIKFEVKEETL